MRRNLSLVAAIAFGLTSCVHQFPDETTPAPLELEFSFDLAIEMPEFAENRSAGTKSAPSDQMHDLRYQVRAYRILNNGMYAEEPMASFRFVKDDVDELAHVEHVILPEGRYRLLAWVDYIDHGSDADLYYSTSDFSAIRYNGDYAGSVLDKDVFIGECEIDLVRYASDAVPVKAVFDLERPVGKFEIISNDLDKFKTKILEALLKQQGEDTKAEVNIEDYYAVFTYSSYIPDHFDLTGNTVRDASKNFSFKSSLSELSETEALLGFDYIMIKPEGTTIGVNVDFYDSDDKKVASTGNIEVPLKRGHVTRIRDAYLTKTSEGGIGIDPGFDGDHNIELK